MFLFNQLEDYIIYNMYTILLFVMSASLDNARSPNIVKAFVEHEINQLLQGIMWNTIRGTH